MKYTTDQISAIAECIEQAHAPDKSLSKAQALSRLAPALRRMQRKGHTLDSIRDALRAGGLQVSRQTLSQSLRRPSSKSAAHAKTGGAERAE